MFKKKSKQIPEEILGQQSVDEQDNIVNKGFFKKIYDGMSKTRQSLTSSVENVFKGFAKIDEELYEELEEALILADCGPSASLEIVSELRKKVKDDRLSNIDDIKNALIDIISNVFIESKNEHNSDKFPKVLLIIGVNGVGKTTSIGKIAYNYTKNGRKVVLAAADTFRAAAIDQLEIWAKRTGATLIKQQENSDPGAVVFDSCRATKARDADMLIVDTAGRLHNKVNLMQELAKINRIIEREMPNMHKEVFLVLDATTGQNALSQARQFKDITDMTGIILTKLDGTAKGGIVVGIVKELGIPIKYVGVGEQLDDLLPFDAKEFASAIF